jgi:hypothetical protein
MVARRFEDLIAWQVAHELQREVFAFIARSDVSRDFKFCDQIRESTRSTTRNIAEGFGSVLSKGIRPVPAHRHWIAARNKEPPSRGARSKVSESI